MSTSEYLTALIDDLAAYISEMAATENGANVPVDSVARFLRLYKEQNAKQPLVLSAVRPDFEQIVRQLQAYLETKKSWNELITAGGGQTLLEFVGAVGALNMQAIFRALQENFSDTAQAPSSIFLGVRRLGVRLIRKRPSKVFVTLENAEPSTAVTIPAYSQFYIDEKPFFNRYPISMTLNQPLVQDVPLYEGEVRTAVFTSNGQPFQRFELGDDDFAVCDEDVLCFIGPQAETYRRVTDGIWNYGPADKVFQESTTQYGNVEILLGNNVNGVRPASGVDILFQFAVTSGSQSNISQANLRVTSKDFSNVTGVSTSHATGGEDEKDITFYRNVGASIFAAKDRAVTEADFVQKCLVYPGIIDVKVMGQREIAPDKVTRMNVVGIIILTDQPWTSLQRADFLAYLEKYSITSLNFLIEDASEVLLNLEANIYCRSGVDLDAAKNFLINKIREQFRLRQGSLGFSLYRSDLETILNDKTFNVDYVKIVLPGTSEVTVNKRAYIRINNITLNMFYSSRPNLL